MLFLIIIDDFPLDDLQSDSESFVEEYSENDEKKHFENSTSPNRADDVSFTCLLFFLIE